MKKKTFFRRKKELLLCLFVILFGSMSCAEKFIVVSNTNVYHVRSGVVFSVHYDSSLNTYDEFKLPKEEFRKILKNRYRATEDNTAP